MIAIFAAMDTEVHPLLFGAAVRKTDDIDGFEVTHVDYGGVNAVICRTGIGRCAAAAAASVLDSSHFAVAMSFGTAGGISPALRAGDIVVCDPVCVSADCGYCDEDGSITAHGGLLDVARKGVEPSGLLVLAGTSLTVDRAVLTAAEKQRLRDSYGHDVVEMESYWIGKAAILQCLWASSVLSRLASWAREHPDEVTVLAKLYDRWRLGAAAMAQFAEAFLRPSVLASLIAVR